MADPAERVLILTHELSFRGSSVLAMRLAQGLEQHGVDTVVVCGHRGTLDSELTKNVRIEQLPGYTVPLWGRLVGRTVLSHLAERPPDVIHVQGPKMIPQAVALARTLECPVVVSISDQSEATRLLLTGDCHPVQAIACVSDSVKAALPQRLHQIEQRVILPGVPLDPSGRVAAVLQEDQTPVIGMAGPLEVIKGGSFFLRACHRVLEAGEQIRIVVAGSGPEERNLRRLATSLELNDHITFVDDGTAMSTYLSAVDIFCLPSLQQGFGIILLEAMALGRPVVASGVGGILSVLEDNRTGMIVPPSDSRALADCLLSLLKNPERTRKLGIAGQNIVEDRFMVTRMVDDMLALYNDVIGRNRAAESIPLTTASGYPTP